MAFFSTPGIELLYSGVTIRRPSAVAILLFSSCTVFGMPSASSTSPSYKGIPRMEAISTVVPAGAACDGLYLFETDLSVSRLLGGLNQDAETV
jgi:hypothetical protein